MIALATFPIAAGEDFEPPQAAPRRQTGRAKVYIGKRYILHAHLRALVSARSGLRPPVGPEPTCTKPSTECLQHSRKHSGRVAACRDLELVLTLDGAKGRPRSPGVAGLPLKKPRRIGSELALEPRSS